MKNKHLHLDGKITIYNVTYDRIDILTQMFTFNQENSYHPENNLFFHTWQVARQLENENINLWLAGIFHDVGKLKAYQNKERDGKKYKTFIGHDKASVSYIKKYLLNTNIFSTKGVIVEKILWLVGEHLRVMMYDVMRPIKKQVLDTNKWWGDLKKLRKADENGRKTTHELEF